MDEMLMQEEDIDSDVNGEEGVVLGETRETRFKRIAQKRMTRLLREIDLLVNLTSPNYKFTETEVDAMFAAIDQAVDHARHSYRQVLNRGGEAKARPGFSF